jgi:hypothetical protein
MEMKNKQYGISFELWLSYKLGYNYKTFPMPFVFISKFLNNTVNQVNDQVIN